MCISSCVLWTLYIKRFMQKCSVTKAAHSTGILAVISRSHASTVLSPLALHSATVFSHVFFHFVLLTTHKKKCSEAGLLIKQDIWGLIGQVNSFPTETIQTPSEELVLCQPRYKT